MKLGHGHKNRLITLVEKRFDQVGNFNHKIVFRSNNKDFYNSSVKSPLRNHGKIGKLNSMFK